MNWKIIFAIQLFAGFDMEVRRKTPSHNSLNCFTDVIGPFTEILCSVLLGINIISAIGISRHQSFASARLG